MKKIMVTIIVFLVLAVAGILGYRYFRARQSAAAMSSYQTSLASRGNLTATVGATGTVRSDQSAVLAWQVTGTVGEVNVTTSERVEARAVLANLKSDSLPQNVILAQSDLINAQKSLDDLQNSKVTQARASQTVAEAQRAVIEAQRALAKFEEDDYQNELDDARTEVVKAKEDFDQAKDDFEPYKDWDVDNATRKTYADRLDEAQRKYDEAVRARDLLELDKQKAQADLDLANARLADAQREYNRVKDSPNADDVAALQAHIRAAQAALNLARLEAPFAGVITEVDIQAGDQVAPGSAAFRIDDLSRLLVDVRVSEVDVNRVALGQGVSLTLDAIPGKEYHGVVNKVAQVGTNQQGTVDFIVRVELTDADPDVRPGMTSAVNVVVNELQNVLLVPNRAVRVVDGQRVVYVLREQKLEMVRVTLGASSDNESQVTDGDLRLGDTIVLNPPQVFDQSGPPPFVRR